MSSLTRRSVLFDKIQFIGRLLAALMLATSLGLAPALAQQERYLDVRRPSEFKPIAIAVTAFAGDAAASAQLTGIITNNFKRSVFLAPIDPKTFVDQITNPNQAPQMDAMAHDQCAIRRNRAHRPQP